MATILQRFVFVIALLAFLGAGLVYLAMSTGLISTSARPPHSALTNWVLHYTFRRSVKRGATEVVLPERLELGDPGLIQLGAQHYANTCESCHGGPGLGQSPLALSMRPSPQHLPSVVRQFTDEELFWIVKEGVRFTPMPAWPADGNFEEIWAVVAFLRQLPAMTADEFAALRTVSVADAPLTPWGTTGEPASVSLGAPQQPEDEYAYTAPTPGWTPIGLDERPLARCVACHGQDGTGTVTGGQVPNLTLLTEQEISEALHGYAEGRIESGMMAVVVSALSKSQIAALAEHFAETLPDRPSAMSSVGDPVSGARIANVGKPQAGVPACLTCHAEAVRNRIPLIHPPALAGQSAPYLVRKLDALSEIPTVGRIIEGWHPMRGIAAALTAKDRNDLAAYFASLPPGKAPIAQPAAAPEGYVATSEDLLSRICARCHTAPLNGDAAAGIPNLTAQSAVYLALQLWAFHDERRPSSQMLEVAKSLKGQQIEALAAYLNGLPKRAAGGPSTALSEIPAAELNSAKRLATAGDPARGIQACSTCHGEAGREALSFVPVLEGQGPTYLERRLASFSEGGGAAAYSPMNLIASALTDAERRALAQFYAGN